MGLPMRNCALKAGTTRLRSANYCSSERFHDCAIDELNQPIYDAGVRDGFLLYDHDRLDFAVLKHAVGRHSTNYDQVPVAAIYFDRLSLDC